MSIPADFKFVVCEKCSTEMSRVFHIEETCPKEEPIEDQR